MSKKTSNLTIKEFTKLLKTFSKRTEFRRKNMRVFLKFQEKYGKRISKYLYNRYLPPAKPKKRTLDFYKNVILKAFRSYSTTSEWVSMDATSYAIYAREKKEDSEFYKKIQSKDPFRKFKRWTFKEAMEIANQFENANEFNRQYPGAYRFLTNSSKYASEYKKLLFSKKISCKRGHAMKIQPNIKWTKEKVLALSKNCSSLTDFSHNHNGAYNFSLREGEDFMLEVRRSIGSDCPTDTIQIRS